MAIEWRPAASADLADAYGWYESQAEGLGEAFFHEVRTATRVLESHPHAFPEVHRRVRRVVVHRFPYNVFYRIQDHRVHILAVFHASRDPAAWQERIDAND